MNVLDLQAPTLDNPMTPSLEMPKPVLKENKRPKPAEIDEPVRMTSPEKLLFGGKSPAQILFEKNNKKAVNNDPPMQSEAVDMLDEPEDMTKSMVKREEVKNIVGEINDIVGGIDDIFTPGGSRVPEKAKGLHDFTQSIQKQEEKQPQKAQFDDMEVTTGVCKF